MNSKIESSTEEGRALLTISEAAEFLNVSKVTIRRWTNDGKLPCVRVGSRQERRFLHSDLQNLLSKSPAFDDETRDSTDQSKGTHRCVLCDEAQHGWDAIVHEIVSHLISDAQVTFVGDAARKKRLVNALGGSGSDPQAAIKAGALRLLSIEESYLISGSFSGNRAAAFVEATILDARSRGFDRTLFVGWSDWLSNPELYAFKPKDNEVAEYERKVDEMIMRYPRSTVLCPYTISEVAPTMLVELAALHPQIQFQSQNVYGLRSSAEVR